MKRFLLFLVILFSFLFINRGVNDSYISLGSVDVIQATDNDFSFLSNIFPAGTVVISSNNREGTVIGKHNDNSGTFTSFPGAPGIIRKSGVSLGFSSNFLCNNFNSESYSNSNIKIRAP